jgi:hypothetical protein
MREEADREIEDAWELSDGSAAQRADIEDDSGMELALLAYAQRSAARAGAEWFAAEFARREEEEQSHRQAVARWEPAQPPSSGPPESELVDASVEDNLIGGAPTGLGIAPPPPRALEPAPAAEPEPEPEPAPPEPEPEPAQPEPEPAPSPPVMRHPHVPRPPAPPEAATPAKRRRWGRAPVTEPPPTPLPPQISAPEWARMSPGARKLYGVEASAGD